MPLTRSTGAMDFAAIELSRVHRRKPPQQRENNEEHFVPCQKIASSFIARNSGRLINSLVVPNAPRLGTSQNLPDIREVDPPLSAISSDTSIDYQITSAIDNTRRFLGTPINYGDPLAIIPLYRNTSSKWLPLRAQRAELGEERSDLAKKIQALGEEHGYQSKCYNKGLSELNKNRRVSNFNSTFGVQGRNNTDLFSTLEHKLQLDFTSHQERQNIAWRTCQEFSSDQIDRMDDFHSGACFEFAFYVSDQLQQTNQTLLVVSLTPDFCSKSFLGFGHTICLIVNEHEIEPEDFCLREPKHSWGQDFRIVDAWSNDSYKFSELSGNPSSHLTFLQKATRNSVRKVLEQGLGTISVFPISNGTSDIELSRPLEGIFA